MSVRYVSLGIILDDVVFHDGRTQMGVLGGGGPQTVWGMALAAPDGAEVGLIAGVNQAFDRRLLAPLDAMRIDLAGVRANDLPTPRAWQLLEADDRRQHVWRVDQATSDLQTHPDAATILHAYPDVAVVHWGIHPEAPHLTPCAPLHAAGVLVSLEPFKGLDQPLVDDALAELLGACAIYSPTWDEAVSIFGTAERAALLDRARSCGGRLLVLRKGQAGAEAWDLVRGEGIAVPAAPVPAVVDPVGAGDAFCGAFAVTWRRTGDLARAAISGAVAASYLLEQVGLPPDPPSAASLEARTAAVEAGLNRLNLHR